MATLTGPVLVVSVSVLSLRFVIVPRTIVSGDAGDALAVAGAAVESCADAPFEASCVEHPAASVTPAMKASA
jgi:hypothetical protein